MASDAITLDQLRRIAAKDEGGLRSDYPDGELPDEWEAELAEHPGETPMSALYRVVVLKSFYRERARERNHAQASPHDAQAAAYDLLRRTPVTLTLANGRRVDVTGRSVSCLTEIAAHQLRVKVLDAEIDALASIATRLSNRRPRGLWRRPGRRARRMLRKIADLHRRTFTERERHRARMYAHIFTASGAPASPDEPPPSWWREIAPEDDAAIMFALLEAGPRRYGRLGEPPRQGRAATKTPAEDWGMEGVLVAWGIRKRVEPARMLDQDLGQALAEMRLSHPPTLEELGG